MGTGKVDPRKPSVPREPRIDDVIGLEQSAMLVQRNELDAGNDRGWQTAVHLHGAARADGIH